MFYRGPISTQTWVSLSADHSPSSLSFPLSYTVLERQRGRKQTGLATPTEKRNRVRSDSDSVNMIGSVSCRQAGGARLSPQSDQSIPDNIQVMLLPGLEPLGPEERSRPIVGICVQALP